MKDVTRAPLVPSDSLETCTRTSWFRLSISSMGPVASRLGSSPSSLSASGSASSSAPDIMARPASVRLAV